MTRRHPRHDSCSRVPVHVNLHPKAVVAAPRGRRGVANAALRSLGTACRYDGWTRERARSVIGACISCRYDGGTDARAPSVASACSWGANLRHRLPLMDMTIDDPATILVVEDDDAT